MRFVGVCTPWSHFKPKLGTLCSDSSVCSGSRLDFKITELTVLVLKLKEFLTDWKNIFSARISGGGILGGNKLTKWGKSIRSLFVMKTPNKFNWNSEKNEVWFDHFQMEFGLHIWWLGSPHEYFEMVEYQGDSPLRSDRTGNWLFLYQNAWFPKVIYIGKHYGFPHFCQFVSPKFRPPDLRDEKIFFQSVKNSFNFRTRTVSSVILKSKRDPEHTEPSLQSVPSFGLKCDQGVHTPTKRIIW